MCVERERESFYFFNLLNYFAFTYNTLGQLVTQIQEPVLRDVNRMSQGPPITP